ncbi:MAG: hypothetical protein KAH91_02380, partial [Thermoplasmatales archaeon]|nr:hypothetical protein [Thermoplasmatales archaeon]
MTRFRDKKVILTLGIAVMFLLSGSMLTTGSNIIKLDNNDMIIYEYNNDNQILITFNMQDLLEDQIVNEYGTFTTLDIPGEGFLGNLGKPQLPIVTCLFAVPTTDVSLNIGNTISTTSPAGKIYPAQSPQTDSGTGDETEFIIDEEFYQQDIEYPGLIGELTYSGKIRDISFVKVELYPIQFNPKQEIATIYDEITIELSWNEGQVVDVESDFYNAPFSKFYGNVFQNWEGFLDHTEIAQPLNGPKEDGCDYLIITHPNFYTEIVELANWKHSKGLITQVVDTDTIGSSSSAIKNYIQNAYDTWDPRPSYLLLVGDAEFVPTSASGTDLYYATVDGSDYFPDLFHGRLPADTSQEAELIVDKIITYEQNPPSSSSFYENFAVAAYFQDDEPNGYETRRFVRTSEEVRDYLLILGYTGERIYVTASYINPTNYNNGFYGNGEPLPPELLRPTFAW